MVVLKRAREAYKDVQIVMPTGHGFEAYGAEAWRLGVLDYLRKPAPKG
jgi:ActR/RegA family two-component response regulator